MSFNLLADGLARGWQLPENGDCSELAGVQAHLPTPPLTAYYPELNEADVAGDARALEGCAARAPRGCAFVPLPPVAVAEAENGEKAHRHFFRCPKAAIEWKHRWPMLRSLMLEHSPDLIGLQELDFEEGPNGWHQSTNVLRKMEEAGYSSTCLKKRGRACDGVGLLWRRGKFTALGDPFTWRLSRSSVHVALGQRLLLESSVEILVVVTHLKAGMNEASESERCCQVEELLSRIKSCNLPTLVLADMNCSHQTLVSDTGTFLEPKALPRLLEGGLCSAHAVVAGSDPEFTLWGGWSTHDVVCSFDWAFYLGRRLVPRRVLSMPTPEEVLAFPDRLPNERFPSDHLPVVLDLDVLAPGYTAPSEAEKGARRRGQRGPRRGGSGVKGRGRGRAADDDEEGLEGGGAGGAG